MKKRLFFLLILMVLCGAAAILFYQENIKAVMNRDAEENSVIRNFEGRTTMTAITCNVDWGNEVLPDMLRIFDEKKIKITFFVSGRWAENNPDLLNDMHLRGHEIQNHGYAHKLCGSLTEAEIADEILKTEKAVHDVIGIKTTLFAPPAGDYDSRTIRTCKKLGYRLTLWSADTIDWKQGSTADIIYGRIMKKPLQGGIILMHPKPETVKALPRLIDDIKAKGLKIVPLGEMIQSVR